MHAVENREDALRRALTISRQQADRYANALQWLCRLHERQRVDGPHAVTQAEWRDALQLAQLVLSDNPPDPIC